MIRLGGVVRWQRSAEWSVTGVTVVTQTPVTA